MRESEKETGWRQRERERESERERERETGREKRRARERVVPECSISLIVVMTTAGEELQDTLINRL